MGGGVTEEAMRAQFERLNDQSNEVCEIGEEEEDEMRVNLLTEMEEAGISTDDFNDMLPDHVFWDIKKPVRDDPESYWNKYNNARSVSGSNLFEMRSTERYFRGQKLKNNTHNNISYYAKY